MDARRGACRPRRRRARRPPPDGYTLHLAHRPRRHRPAGPALSRHRTRRHPVTAYDEQHERDLHLIVVRRDLTGFQHVHPSLDRRRATWSVPPTSRPGRGGCVADTRPTGGGAAGARRRPARARRLRRRSRSARTGSMPPSTATTSPSAAASSAGQETVLTATVTRDGEPVTDLQPYLGAYGHLVVAARRRPRLPARAPRGRRRPGPRSPSRRRSPRAGRYRLFLDFRHGDVVHTAAFTVTVEAAAGRADRRLTTTTSSSTSRA